MAVAAAPRATARALFGLAVGVVAVGGSVSVGFVIVVKSAGAGSLVVVVLGNVMKRRITSSSCSTTTSRRSRDNSSSSAGFRHGNDSLLTGTWFLGVVFVGQLFTWLALPVHVLTSTVEAVNTKQ